MPGAKLPEPEYVAARRVLLDAYEALGTHRKAVVLVGAQAIYLHVGEGDLAVTPYTTDGDLAIERSRVVQELVDVVDAGAGEQRVAACRRRAEAPQDQPEVGRRHRQREHARVVDHGVKGSETCD